jgi:hypothetical protein
MTGVTTDTGSFRHGADEQRPGSTTRHRNRYPAMRAVSRDRAVAVMSDGSYLLMSYPHAESTAFVVRDNAGPLRQALKSAFGYPTGGTACEHDNNNGTAVPGDGITHIKNIQL